MKNTLKTGICLLILSTCINPGCSKKALDDYYDRQSNLAQSIYQQLSARGNFKSLLTLIDKAGYKQSLGGAGYWTYVGNRWSDLVRIALRRNDPSYLANRVYNKLLQDGNGQAAAVQTKLMNPANWYLPFKLQ